MIPLLLIQIGNGSGASVVAESLEYTAPQGRWHYESGERWHYSAGDRWHYLI